MTIRRTWLLSLTLAFGGPAACALGGEGEAAPRIISLSPHITELLFAAGAGGRIVGVDDASDYPPAVAGIARVGEPSALDLKEAKASAANVEGVLWRAFDVITPASHFVSEEMVGVVTGVERGEITRDSAIALVNDMARNSFDEKQRQFFSAVRDLIGQVDAQRREAEKRDG